MNTRMNGNEHWNIFSWTWRVGVWQQKRKSQKCKKKPRPKSLQSHPNWVQKWTIWPKIRNKSFSIFEVMSIRLKLPFNHFSFCLISNMHSFLLWQISGSNIFTFLALWIWPSDLDRTWTLKRIQLNLWVKAIKNVKLKLFYSLKTKIMC